MATPRRQSLMVPKSVTRELHTTFWALWDAVTNLAEATRKHGRVLYLHKLENCLVSYSTTAQRRRRQKR